MCNPHLLGWLGRVLPNEHLMRVCVIAMVSGRSFVYFDRMRIFAQACSAAAGVAAMPDKLRTALRRLSFEVRLGYYRFCEHDDRPRGPAPGGRASRGHHDPARRRGGLTVLSAVLRDRFRSPSGSADLRRSCSAAGAPSARTRA
jgi:hypothetical protein